MPGTSDQQDPRLLHIITRGEAGRKLDVTAVAAARVEVK
jgi:hypothetical protein